MCYLSHVGWPPAQDFRCKSAEQTVQNTAFKDTAGHVTAFPGHPVTALRKLRQKWGSLCLLAVLDSAF